MPAFPFRPRRLLAPLVIVASLSVAACGGAGSADDSESASGPAPVRFTTDSFVVGLPMWVGLDQGYFEEQDLEVSPQTYQTGVDGIKAVVAGQADVAVALDFGMMTALSDGLKVVGVVASPAAGFNKLAVQGSITDPAQLSGKKMGFLPGTAQEYLTREFLAGQDLDDVEMVSLPGLFEVVGALKSSNIDGGFVFADGVAQVEEDKKLEIIGDDSSVITPGVQGIYLVAKEEWAASHQDVLERLLAAYSKAIDFALESPAEAASITADAVKGDASSIEAASAVEHWEMAFTADQLGWLGKQQAFLESAGNTNATGDLESYFDLAAMEEAVPGSVNAWSE
ncbi:ABC transporter substrate-binding protein [Nocardioides sp. LMS-CY]|uniref:ABC transporter substrate-binding protein n=1 Tax=Nocardioides sp. (strain LMS-CY) TaxID=2840457 RepID=UPI001C007190|nr:ABC transporter substrate-binding protein [Nocardioides sp. LMS-CY]QWF20798.1 ABC transporter substrate-binding protein [Nocardioides sp. LMS-CY]